MDKYTKLLLAVAVVVLISLAGLYLYLKKPTQTDQSDFTGSVNEQEFPEDPQKGDLGYQEEQTTVKIGSEGVTKGTFERAEGGNIFVREGATLTQLPLTVDEVVLACSNQNLETVNELDFDQIARIIISNPNDIGGQIPPNEPIVLFASDVEGTLRVHTVAVASDNCLEE